MVLPALGTLALALASATPRGYMHCKAGGWGNNNCPVVIAAYESLAWCGMAIGYHLLTGTEEEIEYDDFPVGYHGPIEKWQRDARVYWYMYEIRMEARAWARTTELMIPPAYELADWTKDLVVVPPSEPGELMLWTPPHTGIPWELAHTMFPPDDPAPVYDIVFDSTTVAEAEPPFRGHTTVPVSSALSTQVYDTPAAPNDGGLLLTVIAFFTLVFGLIGAETLTIVEPARQVWRSSGFGNLGALGVLGSVEYAFYGFIVRSSSGCCIYRC